MNNEYLAVIESCLNIIYEHIVYASSEEEAQSRARGILGAHYPNGKIISVKFYRKI